MKGRETAPFPDPIPTILNPIIRTDLLPKRIHVSSIVRTNGGWDA
jgi:hypothetical protein